MFVRRNSPFKRYSLFWSFFLHALLLITYFFFQYYHFFHPSPTWLLTHEHPSLDVSAYVYHPPAPLQPASQPRSASLLRRAAPTDPNGIKKAANAVPASALSSAATAAPSTASEAIHLLGDKNKPPKPLVKMIGIALTRHLIYPKIAMDFNLKGKVLVGFIIHPDGAVTDVTLAQSSKAALLDQAALQAVQAMSPVSGVGPYVPQAKYLVIGILFR